MAVTILGTPQQIDDGGSYTAETGSNRMVVVAFTYEWVSGGTGVTSITLGSQAFSQANRGKNTGNGELGTAIYYIKEADIPSGSNTFDITWTGTTNGVTSGTIYTLGGVDQTTSYNTEKSTFTSTSTPSDTITSADDSVCIATSGTHVVPSPADNDERVALDGTTFTQTGWSGAYTDIDEDPDSPDGLWIAAPDNNTDTDVLASFGAVTGTLSAGADKQEFKVYVRQFDGGQTGTPQVRIELWESGSLVRAGTAANVNSSTGETHTFTWNKTELTTESGANAEIKVFGLKSGGSPGARNAVDIGAVEWNAKVEGAATAWTAPSGWTERRDEAEASDNFYIYQADKTVTTGATETFDPTLPESGNGHIVLINVLPAASGISVTATTGATTLAAVDATISTTIPVTATTAATTLAAVDATVSTTIPVTATTGALSVDSYDATISTTIPIITTTGAVDLAAIDATITTQGTTTVTATTGSLSLAAIDADISVGISITATTEALTVVGVDTEIDITPLLQVNDTFSNTYVDAADILLRSSILINEATSATTIDSVNITRVHNLSANDTTSVTSIDSVDIARTAILTANEVTSATSIDSVNINRKTSIDANDQSSSTSIDSVDIIRVALLTANDHFSTTSIDSVDLKSYHNLLTNDAFSNTYIDSPTITISGASGPFEHRNLWLADALGVEGDVRDMWVDYFISQSADGISGDSYNDLAFQWLGSLGYIGSLSDRWDAWERDENIGI